MTEGDMKIRKTDIPERYQELRAGITDYGNMSSEDQELERNWIAEKFLWIRTSMPIMISLNLKKQLGTQSNLSPKKT